MSESACSSCSNGDAPGQSPWSPHGPAPHIAHREGDINVYHHKDCTHFRKTISNHRTFKPPDLLTSDRPSQFVSTNTRMTGPGNFSGIHKICKLVVLLCFLHISVILIFYIRFAFLPTLQPNTRKNSTIGSNTVTSNVVSTIKEPSSASQERPAGNSSRKLPPAGGSPRGPGGLARCPETSPLLVGPLRIEFNSPVSLEQVIQENPAVGPGGRHTPKDCTALQKVAIIIPFRDREAHLKFWLYYLHPILQRQQLDYGIYVISQEGTETFNRAKLFNVGYMEALKDYDYGCFVFSDVDLIPMDDRNTYKCFEQPRHLSVLVDKFGFKLPYYQCFGGVSSMSKEQFLKINGFPNNYWGWGGEDDDVYSRVTTKGMSISRPSGAVGNFRMIRHDRDKKNEPNPQRFNRLAHARENMGKDGINSLTYEVIQKERRALYTYVGVQVGKP